MTDLATLDLIKLANQGFDLALRHPGANEIELDFRLRLLGRDSDAFTAIQQRQSAERISAMKREQRFAEAPEVTERYASELLTACVVGWSPVLFDGKPFEYSKANAETLINRFPWVREQVDTAVGDRSRLAFEIEASNVVDEAQPVAQTS